MARKKKTIIDIWVDHCLQDDSWTIKHREKDAETREVIREISEPLTEEIVLSACKLFAKRASLDHPHIIETPHGIYKCIGGGYFFPTATRDAQYVLLSSEETDSILNGPKPNIFQRVYYKVQWQFIIGKNKIKDWLGMNPRAKEGVEVVAPAVPAASGEDTEKRASCPGSTDSPCAR